MFPVKRIVNQGLGFWDPFRDIERVHDEMDRTLTLFLRSPENGLAWGAAWVPSIEVSEDEDRFTVRAEIPGVTKGEVSLNLTDDVLTIRGERKNNREEKSDHYLFRETTYGTFHREVVLPEAVKAEQAKAEYKDGILTVTLPKAGDSKRHEIKIDVK